MKQHPSPLAAYRYMERITLRDLAQAVGCAPSTLSRIEKGTQIPTFATAEAIVQATNGRVSLGDLFRRNAA